MPTSALGCIVNYRDIRPALPTPDLHLPLLPRPYMDLPYIQHKYTRPPLPIRSLILALSRP